MRTIRGLLVSLVVLGPVDAVLAAAPDPYATQIALSDVASGAATSLTFSFRASGGEVEAVGEIDLELAPGAKVSPDAFAQRCLLTEVGPGAGGVCAEQFPDARIGQGEMTVEMLGMHTVTADAYRVDGAPDGANLVFYFRAGQVFGVGAQSIVGQISLDAEAPTRIRIRDIQKQLDLPFGASAELEKGSFTFAGQAGEPAFTNPTDGDVASWGYATRLSWDGGSQTQTVHATAVR